jgi:DNA-binding XRE family transcriptional regulator
VAVLRAHPKSLTFGQLTRELFADPHDFLTGYSLACAVRELVVDGLLQSDGLHVVPTHAALFFAAWRAEAMSAYETVARRSGANLAKARKRSGLSQEELGFRAELHRTQIGVLERGARLPRIDTLVKLAAALHVPIACPLLEGTGWRSAVAELGGFSVSPDDAEKDSSDV